MAVNSVTCFQASTLREIFYVFSERAYTLKISSIAQGQ
ncbi:hypothetical protein SNOG_03835 [Parastagonospora nodorum SN15]|uniref:Uncharacterized protein n=1 Tax=Phaeosphaeria nodorum (strain SN15 / ATCC MYA-4574 / FGSC 10173) TaxID=321614 RepID=Q0UWM9_PHANO|nr:hypothetical protein SNOG_03835 [Parastagonospora nodorum SN15]EAT89040.1 hypothetical protein SNOG_03835 [Parastagonospora nodorum SN15]